MTTLDYEAKREAQRKMRENPEIGSVWYTSWGYDQTNVEYFEVVARTDKSVKLRRIRTMIIESRVYPVTGSYTRDYGLDGNHGSKAHDKAEAAGYSEAGWRRFERGIRIDTTGYIRYAHPYVGGGAHDTIASGQQGH